MNKSFAVLYLYEKLKRGERIYISSCCEEYQISIPTFRRYVSTLREFFGEQHAQKIFYDREQKAYYLINNTGK